MLGRVTKGLVGPSGGGHVGRSPMERLRKELVDSKANDLWAWGPVTGLPGHPGPIYLLRVPCQGQSEGTGRHGVRPRRRAPFQAGAGGTSSTETRATRGHPGPATTAVRSSPPSLSTCWLSSSATCQRLLSSSEATGRSGKKALLWPARACFSAALQGRERESARP